LDAIKDIIQYGTKDLIFQFIWFDKFYETITNFFG